MLVKENLNDILKAKTSKDIVNSIETESGVLDFFIENLEYPSVAPETHFNENDIKIDDENNLVFNMTIDSFEDDYELRIDMNMIVDLNGEYECDLYGYSESDEYSDFYFSNYEVGDLVSFYEKPRDFLIELQNILNKLASDATYDIVDEFEKEYDEDLNELNEAIILPDQTLYKKMINEFFKAQNVYDPFTYLNDALRPEMELIDFEGHLANLHPKERQVISNSNQIPELGIRLYGFDPDENSVILFVDNSFDDKLIEIPRQRLKELLDKMWSGIGHENIHQQQTSRMKKLQNPTFKSREEYFGNKQEIMAHAFSFIQEMKDLGLSKEGILKNLKTSKPSTNRIKNVYLDLGGKPLKLFLKYAVQYLEELF